MPDLESLPTLSLLIFMKLRHANSIITRRLTKVLRDSWKLEINEALALIVAENNPLISQAAIGEALDLHPNVMVGLVRRLQKRRQITVKSHPHDGRKTVITLTAQGLEVVRDIRVKHPEILDLVLPLSGEARRQLDEVATVIINSETSGDGKRNGKNN